MELNFKREENQYCENIKKVVNGSRTKGTPEIPFPGYKGQGNQAIGYSCPHVGAHDNGDSVGNGENPSAGQPDHQRSNR